MNDDINLPPLPRGDVYVRGTMTASSMYAFSEHALREYARAAVLADREARTEGLRDCRTCRNYGFFDACLSVIKCVDGAAYQGGGWSVRLWEGR